MTAAPSEPAPDWLRAMVAARCRYEEEYGWPVRMEVARRRLVMVAGHAVNAIVAPGSLGAPAHRLLVEAGVVAPIITDQDGRWWTLLTQVGPGRRRTVPASLHRAGVRALHDGSQFVVPAGVDAVAAPSCRWIRCPRPHQPLPGWAAVVAYLDAALGHARAEQIQQGRASTLGWG